jgi:hypothetical protein
MRWRATMADWMLVDVLPAFTRELDDALLADDEPAPAEQVVSLRIIYLCECRNSFCPSFYVGSRPVGKWSTEGPHRNVLTDVEPGMVILDVVAGIIRYVEVLDRPDVCAVFTEASASIEPSLRPSDE